MRQATTGGCGGADERQHQDDETGCSQRIMVISQRFGVLDSSEPVSQATRVPNSGTL
jgi:hypothetical protein